MVALIRAIFKKGGEVEVGLYLEVIKFIARFFSSSLADSC
jgi:hypothetical protein